MNQNSNRQEHELETDAQDWSEIFDNGKSKKANRIANKQAARKRRQQLKELRDEDDWN